MAKSKTFEVVKDDIEPVSIEEFEAAAEAEAEVQDADGFHDEEGPDQLDAFAQGVPMSVDELFGAYGAAQFEVAKLRQQVQILVQDRQKLKAEIKTLANTVKTKEATLRNLARKK